MLKQNWLLKKKFRFLNKSDSDSDNLRQNPKAGKQFFFSIESCLFLDFNIKRCLYRTVSFAGLLFISETIPNFGSILDLGKQNIRPLTLSGIGFFQI